MASANSSKQQGAQPPQAPVSIRRIQLAMDQLRHRLAHLDALPQLTLLGFIAGIAAALLVVAFRLSIEWPLQWLLDGGAEDFESLSAFWHFALPFGGAVVIGLLLQWVPANARSVSVGHVVERLSNHQGKLPLSNWLVQFFGGILALISGQSVGREGPAVHLGAGAASQLGQWLHLPNNCLRTLVGCGVASAIAASFNTPMAGVIFSMEVILMEYSVAGFIPVIMASVTGALIGQLIFGGETVFDLPPVRMNDFWELPIIIGTGLCVALFAAVFIRLQLLVSQKVTLPLWIKLGLAGCVTGVFAIWYPQILGVGYDTIDLALSGNLELNLILGILCAKVIATALSGGLGMPGGLIGPMLFIGALVGGAIGIVISAITPESGASPSFYVLLGMGAMMASVINAPLAALITVFEMTHNPNTIFPTMLIIVVAVITTRQLFRCDGIFLAQLEANGYTLNSGPVRQALNRVGVRSVMDTLFQRTDHQQTLTQLRQHLSLKPTWLVVDAPEDIKYLLAAADVSAYVESLDNRDNTSEAEQTKDAAMSNGDTIDLLEIPGRQWRLKAIDHQASLLDAQQILDKLKADALYVERKTAPWLSPMIGIITKDHIMNHYRV